MRLDLGPDGKIIGTRRVSPNGQVSGLSEYAGREVLVIIPGSSETSSPPWPTPESVTQLVSEQIREAYQRYQALQEMYSTPWEATRSFMQSVMGGQVPDMLAQVDRWVKSQVQDAKPGRSSQTTGSPDERDPKSTGTEGSSASRRSGSSGRKRP